MASTVAATSVTSVRGLTNVSGCSPVMSGPMSVRVGALTHIGHLKLRTVAAPHSRRSPMVVRAAADEGGVVDSLKNAVSGAADSVKSAASKTKGKVQDVAGDAKGKVSGAAGSLKEKAQQSSDNLESKTKDLASQAEGAAKDAKSQAQQSTKDLEGKAKDVESQAEGKAKEFGSKAESSSKDLTGEAENLKDKAVGQAQEARQDLKKEAGKATDNAHSTFDDASGKAKSGVDEASNKAKSVLAPKPQLNKVVAAITICESIRNALAELRSGYGRVLKTNESSTTIIEVIFKYLRKALLDVQVRYAHNPTRLTKAGLSFNTLERIRMAVG
ncbi:unnamed protein product [Calypogeia fissa]